ncbi:MAG TPA: hypothetical protein VH741_03580 [Candidatus Limnocylindrales bacterium]|jgi:hypothetical protein
MSRRNSASRRRSYGRRRHEMNERRAQRPAPRDAWLADADAGDGGWQPGAGGMAGDGGTLRDARGRAD